MQPQDYWSIETKQEHYELTMIHNHGTEGRTRSTTMDLEGGQGPHVAPPRHLHQILWHEIV